ncbi:MAG: hypothetical protein IPJ98_26255 [Bryobacterales bacterium]|nr:hypothetical protein [Bryobacterales bacterium]
MPVRVPELGFELFALQSALAEFGAKLPARLLNLGAGDDIAVDLGDNLFEQFDIGGASCQRAAQATVARRYFFIRSIIRQGSEF